MPKRIPIKVARDVAKAQGLTHCVIFGYDGTNQHVVTWGKSTVAAAEAADLGNRLKGHLGWDDKHCHAVPARVRNLERANVMLKAQVAAFSTGVASHA